MARIFISYSRNNVDAANAIAQLLAEHNVSVFVDYQEMLGVDHFPERLAREIRGCETLIVLVSADSMESRWVVREVEYADEQRKSIVVMRLDATPLPEAIFYLQRRDYIEASELLTSKTLSDKVRNKLLRTLGLTNEPTPPSTPKYQAQLPDTKRRLSPVLLIAIAAALMLAVGALAFNAFNQSAMTTPTLPPTTAVAQQATLTAVRTAADTAIPTLSPTPPVISDIRTINWEQEGNVFVVQLATENESEISAYQVQIIDSLSGILVSDFTTTDLPPYDELRFSSQNLEQGSYVIRVVALNTENVTLSESQIEFDWTPPPTRTPSADDLTATQIMLTRGASSIETQVWLDITLTALAFTDTPTATATATITPSATVNATQTYQALQATAFMLQTMEAWTDTPTHTPTPTVTPTATFTPLEAALVLAQTPVERNRDWTLFAHVHEDDPVQAHMMLVPVGEFMMGSENGEDAERPAHRQQITSPYWIDRTEVTRAQYQMCVDGGACRSTVSNQYSTQPNQPINNVTWYQGQEYCAYRGMRLPTEREWEYAARGPESWRYPWGDTFNETRVVSRENSNNQPASVGSREGGASWVGALDLSGNVWEWINSTYADYDYRPDDGREDFIRNDVMRVLRGGSFTDSSYYLRAAFRFSLDPALGDYGIGFRCARS
jgi:formylglycine-generating enzyme required for sulfatase activity